MKIAILTSGILTVPAVQGGAVENLTDFYLEYNEQHRLHDITVYSVWHPMVEHHPALQSKANHYQFVQVETPLAKVKKRLYKWTHSQGYYHYTIEYFLEKVLKDLRQKSYDMIILENRPGFALRLKGMTSAKLVYHLHNEKITYQIPQAKAIYQAADRIICVSDYIKRCVQSINTNDTKTITVHNGINLGAFSAKGRKEKKSNDMFTLLFSGRLNAEKGILQLLDALNRLINKANIRLLVIGSSFYGNTNQEDDFIRVLKAKAKPLEKYIEFTGFVPYEQMPDYLKLADVAVIPSVWDDPFPTTVLEAQAMGLPIITTRRGGIPEEVSEENALLLTTDEHFVEHLAEAILDLYQHPEKRERMAAASRSRSHLFSKENYARNFFAALEDIP